METIAKSSIKNSHAGKYTGGFALQSVTCFPAQTEMPWKAAATFLVMLILIFIIIVATGVDLYLGHGHNGKSRFDYHAANDGSCEKHPRNVSGTQLLSPINGGGRSSLHHNVAQLSSDTQHCGYVTLTTHPHTTYTPPPPPPYIHPYTVLGLWWLGGIGGGTANPASVLSLDLEVSLCLQHNVC